MISSNMRLDGIPIIPTHRISAEKRAKGTLSMPYSWLTENVGLSKLVETNTTTETQYYSRFSRQKRLQSSRYQSDHTLPHNSTGRNHHVRKLKDLKAKPNIGMLEKVMIYRHRKTIILCLECHDLLHAGKLPDNRYRPRKV